MKRTSDVLISLTIIILLSPVLLILCVVIKIESDGPIIFKQKRVGHLDRLFTIYKFRTMKTGTPNLATNLINQSNYITRAGYFLRKYSLDELPQLFNILAGDMSIVGPRPALYNQKELIALRKKEGVSSLKPGLTGWAQINGRDNILDEEKVNYDIYYLKNNSVYFDLKIMFLTFFRVISAKGVKA